MESKVVKLVIMGDQHTSDIYLDLSEYYDWLAEGKDLPERARDKYHRRYLFYAQHWSAVRENEE